ncbi:hypothetical protein TEA_018117 [Camellia sinensis var. sinensis]|uniref:Uncharacterized protein n=1 Tax=Camellia sinensis var. sinensis TaxID=542762 RepID=A0A4S4DEA7_CAMSN|nr:hypothetical protein TEA_018117 [Camellia sinensis var. sinensis]
MQMSFPFPLYLYTKLRGVNARVGGRLFSRLVGWQPPFLTSLEVFIPAPFNSFQSLIWTSISFQNDQLSKRPPRDNVHSEREKNEGTETMEGESMEELERSLLEEEEEKEGLGFGSTRSHAGAGTSKKSRPTFGKESLISLMEFAYAFHKHIYPKSIFQGFSDYNISEGKDYYALGVSFAAIANANALKLSCELLRVFVTEAVQRAATIAEAEGARKLGVLCIFHKAVNEQSRSRAGSSLAWQFMNQWAGPLLPLLGAFLAPVAFRYFAPPFPL